MENFRYRTKGVCASEIRFDLEGTPMPHNDITLYAEWRINRYIVIFKDINGTVLKEQELYAHEDATPPDKDMTVEYYTFKGWDKEFTNITADTTVTATYSDESTKTVTDAAVFKGYNLSAAGTQTVTVQYTEEGVTVKDEEGVVRRTGQTAEAIKDIILENSTLLTQEKKKFSQNLDTLIFNTCQRESRRTLQWQQDL